MMAMGQVAFLLVMSVMLQDGRHLSALDTGLWLVPSGVAIVAGSQLGNWLTRRIGTTNVVRAGLFLVATGLAATALVADARRSRSSRCSRRSCSSASASASRARNSTT